MSGVAIPERADIHKSCKSIEVIVNCLNDYCEAANAIVTIQKKLAKALRESAQTKSTAEIAANALNASATIFEALAEVDGKFIKFADKECDHVSSEVKKWFKKLAKEEKAHDDRMASANAKIKQAGQAYEKKAKRNARDAQEEHTRYITLLSSLGPEVAQDKYNHSLNISKRHTEALYTVASSLARVADGEWHRTCEGVKRFSPTIGQLGEWRALCEGGWMGGVPPGYLLDGNESQGSSGEGGNSRNADGSDQQQQQQQQQQQLNQMAQPQPQPQQQPSPQTPSANLSHTPTHEKSNPIPAPEYTSRDPTPSGTLLRPPPPNYTSSPQIPTYPSNPPSPARQELGSTPTQAERGEDANTGMGTNMNVSMTGKDGTWNTRTSIAPPSSAASTLRNLASFPAPPTHFPIPPLDGRGSEDSREERGVGAQKEDRKSPMPSPVIPSPSEIEERMQHASSSGSHTSSNRDVAYTAAEEQKRPLPNAQIQHLHNEPSRTNVDSDPPLNRLGGGYQERQPYRRSSIDPEFGGRDASQQAPASSGTRSTPEVERRRSGSGSVVANLRDKYARNAGPPSPGPKEPPRLPLTGSVSSLAHRYESTAGPGPSSPPPQSQAFPQRPLSPASPYRRTSIEERRRVSSELPALRQNNTGSHPYGAANDRDGSSQRHSPTTAFPSSSANSLFQHQSQPQYRETEQGQPLRRQPIPESSEEHDFHERERMIQQREREIMDQARELERQKTALMTMRNTNANASSNRLRVDGGGEAITNRPQVESPSSSPNLRYDRNLAGSNTYIPSQQNTPSAPPTPSAASSSTHAPYCGCETCSASQYRHQPTSSPPARVDPPISLRPEKPNKGGWIRRLSMPVVGGGFSSSSSSDSKKGIGHNQYSPVSSKNVSVTSLVSSNVNSNAGYNINTNNRNGATSLASNNRGFRSSLALSSSTSGTSPVDEDGKLAYGYQTSRSPVEFNLGGKNRSATNLLRR
ncbi:hypothetical protein K474DRAFT_1661940 [Panus rudis PR-1116 ss-1]|nr:hypothetical protein K474DRAFT_1661940 [Panus rudis PR-1116 ss-1]